MVIIYLINRIVSVTEGTNEEDEDLLNDDDVVVSENEEEKVEVEVEEKKEIVEEKKVEAKEKKEEVKEKKKQPKMTAEELATLLSSNSCIEDLKNGLFRCSLCKRNINSKSQIVTHLNSSLYIWSLSIRYSHKHKVIVEKKEKREKSETK